MPLGMYNELKATIPFLANQSEDCLYLNIYVPGSGRFNISSYFDKVKKINDPYYSKIKLLFQSFEGKRSVDKSWFFILEIQLTFLKPAN